MSQTHTQGYTLVELIAVLILLGILSSVVVSRAFSPSVFELQSSRDQLVAAFQSARQLAMVQVDRVRFSTQGNALAIYQDSNNNDVFESSEIISLNSVSYPLALPSAQTVTVSNFDFDRLGRTSAATLVLTNGSATVTITFSAMGFAN